MYVHRQNNGPPTKVGARDQDGQVSSDCLTMKFIRQITVVFSIGNKSCSRAILPFSVLFTRPVFMEINPG